MEKLTVLLVYGGESSEHEVSLVSAHNVYAALDDDKYNVELCFIDKTGRWWLTEDINSTSSQHQLVPALGQGQFVTFSNNHVIRPDVILPILHGKNGEDGTIQGVAQMLHIPCAGPSLLGAAVTMDKDMTKRLLQATNIPVVPWLLWQTNEDKPSYDSIRQELGEVVFVKPAQAGSSVGVTKVTSADDFADALDEASKHGRTVIIEKAIEAREIELSVLGNERPRVSGAGEIIPGKDFYDYDDKYSADSQSKAVIPADLDPAVLETLQGYALGAYKATAGWGMARVDCFVDKNNGEVFVNEINSIPGFTNISMYPKLWRQAGVSYGQLVDELINLALGKSNVNDLQ